MNHDHDRAVRDGSASPDGNPGLEPGKRSRAEGLPVQRKVGPSAAPTDPTAASSSAERTVGDDPFGLHLPDGSVVQRAGGGEAAAGVHAAAAGGVAGGGGGLPHLDTIQQAFGHHDVTGVQAHTDGAAARAADTIGAEAFAVGNHVAFAGAPSLHTAAHEAAHVVQQRGGVQLLGGVGQAGDPYEQHADQVADLVVGGRSAEALLDARAGDGGAAPEVGRAPVQRIAITDQVVTDWMATNQPSVLLHSGDDATVVETWKHPTLPIKIDITEWMINHVCTGHVMSEFSFAGGNHTRAGVISLFPKATTRDDIVGKIKATLTGLTTQLRDAKDGFKDVISLRGDNVGGNILTGIIRMEWEYDDDGEPESGVGKLEQFYFTTVSGGTNYTKDEMTTLRAKLVEKGHPVKD